jgi:hypothetical protein
LNSRLPAVGNFTRATPATAEARSRLQ